MTISDSAVGDLETLRAVLAGRVFMLGEAGYDEARRVWNLAVDERPAVVVQAESAAHQRPDSTPAAPRHSQPPPA